MTTINRRNSILNKLTSRKKKHVNELFGNEDSCEYVYIKDYINATDKKCIQMDKLNENIYQNNIKIFNDTNNRLSKLNTNLKLTDTPKPPEQPNNFERLQIWRKKNIKKNVQEQTISILYLLSKSINIKLDDFSDGIEPYEAIDTADKIVEEEQDNKYEKVFMFLNSLKLNRTYNNTDINNNSNISKPINIPIKTYSYVEQTSIPCSNPENHTFTEKLDHYKNLSQSSPMLNNINNENDDSRDKSLYPYIVPTAPPYENNVYNSKEC